MGAPLGLLERRPRMLPDLSNTRTMSVGPCSVSRRPAAWPGCGVGHSSSVCGCFGSAPWAASTGAPPGWPDRPAGSPAPAPAPAPAERAGTPGTPPPPRAPPRPPTRCRAPHTGSRPERPLARVDGHHRIPPPLPGVRLDHQVLVQHRRRQVARPALQHLVGEEPGRLAVVDDALLHRVEEVPHLLAVEVVQGRPRVLPAPA